MQKNIIGNYFVCFSYMSKKKIYLTFIQWARLFFFKDLECLENKQARTFANHRLRIATVLILPYEFHKHYKFNHKDSMKMMQNKITILLICLDIVT